MFAGASIITPAPPLPDTACDGDLNAFSFSDYDNTVWVYPGDALDEDGRLTISMTVDPAVDPACVIPAVFQPAPFLLSVSGGFLTATMIGDVRIVARIAMMPEPEPEPELELKFAAWIPGNFVDVPPHPANFCIDPTSTMSPPSNRILVKLAGDNRLGPDPSPDVGHRVQSLSTVLPDGGVTEINGEQVTPDGLLPSSVVLSTGASRSYGADALADGVIDESDNDYDPATGEGLEDCSLLHQIGRAPTDGIDVTTTRLSPTSVQVRLTGETYDPLVVAGPAIDWDITLIFDRSDPTKTVWQGTFGHNGFPAYEVFANGNQLYFESPAGAPPFSFATGGAKLFDNPFTNVSRSETGEF
jgi:hypothetical protein